MLHFRSPVLFEIRLSASVIDSLSQMVDHETSDQFSVSGQLFDVVHMVDLIQQTIDKYYEEDIVRSVFVSRPMK